MNAYDSLYVCSVRGGGFTDAKRFIHARGESSPAFRPPMSILLLNQDCQCDSYDYVPLWPD